jgi:hypothetical protein
VEVDVTGDLGGSWDEGRLTQVIANLVGNALEHGDPETPVSVTLSGGKKEVTIAVHNHGVPIVPSMLSRIFNPMKRRQGRGGRAPDATSHLGLGLYIAERIISAHGGTIDVASSASEGTTFTIHLPRDATLLGRRIRAPRSAGSGAVRSMGYRRWRKRSGSRPWGSYSTEGWATTTPWWVDTPTRNGSGVAARAAGPGSGWPAPGSRRRESASRGARTRRERS